MKQASKYHIKQYLKANVPFSMTTLFIELSTLLIVGNSLALDNSTDTSPACPAANMTIYNIANKNWLIECGFDRQGDDLSDYTLQTTATLDDCVSLCSSTSGCVDVSYIDSFCYLKPLVESPIFNENSLGAGLADGIYPSANSTTYTTNVTSSNYRVRSGSDGWRCYHRARAGFR